MTEQIKAWAVVNNHGNVNENLYNSEYAANTRLAELELIGKFAPYKIIEFISTPKIKMTKAEFDEFKKHRIAYPEFSTFLVDAFRKNMFFERLFNQGGVGTKNRTQLDFARLWASDNPEELVEIEKETQFNLVLKLDDMVGVWDYDVLLDKDSYRLGIGGFIPFTESELGELGDDWFDEMGLKKIEVEE